MDDLEEATSISRETHRVFIYTFLKYGSEYLYPKNVKYPTTAEEMKYHTQ